MRKFVVIMALAMVAGAASAALITGGYSVGSGLLSPNGETLFMDTTAVGGAGDISIGSGSAPFASVLIPGAGFWGIGDTVEITGFALVLRAPNANGLMTFDIRQGAGGTGASGAAGLASLGTATATFSGNGTTDEYYVNFDTPVTFVADVYSTTIGINFSNAGGALAFKTDPSAAWSARRYNYDNGNIVGDGMKVSVAGTVVPEPATVGLVALFGGGILFVRRRLHL